MLREVDHLQGDRPRLADIVKHDDSAGYLAGAVMDRRHGILDRPLKTVPADEERIDVDREWLVVPNGEFERVPRRLPGGGVDHLENLADRATRRLLARPARHLLGDRIEVGDPAVYVGGQNRVADRVECYFGAFPFVEESLLVLPLLDYVLEGARQRLGVVPALDEIVANARAACENVNRFVLRTGHENDRETGGGLPHRLKVRLLDQRAVEQNRRKGSIPDFTKRVGQRALPFDAHRNVLGLGDALPDRDEVGPLRAGEKHDRNAIWRPANLTHMASRLN
ncbi:MAG TPA: hypothetical protein VFB16_10960 [Bauldia sp.]|nr:hypothetical protein [Bauldia sp.]